MIILKINIIGHSSMMGLKDIDGYPNASMEIILHNIVANNIYIYEYTLSTRGPPADAGNRQVGSRMTCLAVSK